MPNWRDEYAGSLKDVELSNPVNMELVQTCSQMADRISALEAEKAAIEARLPTGKGEAKEKAATSDDPGTAQLRLELAEAIRARGVADTRLRTAEAELEKLRAKTKTDTRTLKQLEAERTNLTTKLKDRDHEIREKRKLLEDTQDEIIALNLQLSMAEGERDKVKKENKELVERWMRRMGQEADAMNLANEK